MNICLIFPSISEVGFNSFGNAAFGFPASHIHHGLCSLSASLKRSGFEVELIDMRKLRNWSHFERELRSRKPDIVAATVMSLDCDTVMRCLSISKRVLPDAATVVGGVHPTVSTEELQKERDVDHVVVGEGEMSLVRLLADLKDGKPVEQVIVGEPPDLDELPFIDRELFDYEAELRTPFLPEVFEFEPPFVTIIAGRGCRYNCSFCQPAERKLFGRRLRQRSVENVMSELLQLREKYHFNSLMIHDDTMTQDKHWAQEFAQQYKALGFTQPFFAQSRADFICNEEETIRTLSEAGLRGLSIGFESGSDRVLRFLRKGVSVEQNYRAAEICRRYRIRIFANYMFGVPTETNAEAYQTVQMIKKINPERRSYSFFTPLPGSDLYEYCRERDLSLVDTYAKYNRSLFVPKIKGVDYVYLRRAVEDALDLPWHKKILRYLRRNSLINRSMRLLAPYRPFQMVVLELRHFMYRGQHLEQQQ